MTMQIGMLGTDGVVLASDTRWVRSPLSTNGAVHDGYGSSKIKIDRSGRIAVTCARDMIAASLVADAFMSDLKPEYWENPERRIKEIGCDTMSKMANLDIECFVALAEPVPCFYLFQFVRGGSEVVSARIITCAHTGDTMNGATFWSSRYYQRLPINQLTRLAAQVIVDAGELNTAIIGGLEIVFCDTSGFHRLPEETNRKLESEARKRSKEIGELILTA